MLHISGVGKRETRNLKLQLEVLLGHSKASTRTGGDKPRASFHVFTG